MIRTLLPFLLKRKLAKERSLGKKKKKQSFFSYFYLEYKQEGEKPFYFPALVNKNPLSYFFFCLKF
ncbi:MAG: hypothetical protein MRERV_87c008 [Mycoplasmataceae bacterium RV_VA103A]|nr:MAG: hypothetical protein MRERV_87c008 [Mycoplasmataceae bacterium RV_VA103A]